MTPEQAQQLSNLDTMIHDAVGVGQQNFSGTIKALLASIQQTYNKVGTLKLTIVGVGQGDEPDPTKPERLLVGAGEVKVIADDAIRAELQTANLASTAYVSQATYDLLRP